MASAVAAQPAVPAEARVEKDVVYGMYSGLALLLDVYHPARDGGAFTSTRLYAEPLFP